MKHYGDITQLHGDKLEPVDLIVGGSPCFPAGTLVLTEKGYLPIEDIQEGMLVLTHLGRWRKVTATGHKTGETVILRGNHYGLECTPNHPIYSANEKHVYPTINGKRGHLRKLLDKVWVPAENMNKRLWAVPNRADSLPITEPKYSDKKYVSSQNLMPEYTADFFYFVGRWLGDGWVRNGQRSGRPEGQTGGVIYICDSHDKVDELMSTVAKISEKYGVEKCKTSTKCRFTSLVLCNWLVENFGKGAANKTMPGWVFGLPEEFRLALLQGLIDSDGYKLQGRDNSYRIVTVSKQLAESIRLLAEISGYSTTIHITKVEPTKEIEGRTVNQKDWYSVVMEKGKIRKHLKDDLHGWYRVRSVTPTNEVKTVYNLTVEEDNSYIADGIVVHNCQDLSVAGQRKGLAGERSGLFMDMIRVIKEMRNATNGLYPTYALWENVVGSYSSNDGRDFAAVLTEFARVVEPDAPDVSVPEEGWPKSGVLLGTNWSLSWRTHDAQFWGKTIRDSRTGDVLEMGTPQRRRRIALVADFRGQSAHEILFERKSMSRDSGPGGKERKDSAGTTEESAGDTGGDLTSPENEKPQTVTYGVTTKGNGDAFIAKERHSTLSTGGGMPGQSYPCVMISETVGCDLFHGRITGETASTLTANTDASGNHMGPTVMVDSLTAIGYPEASPGVVKTLDASYYKGPGSRSADERTIVYSELNKTAFSVYENQKGNVSLEEHSQPLTTGGGKPGQGYPCVLEDREETPKCLNPWDIQLKRIAPMDGVADTLNAAEKRYGGGESLVFIENDKAESEKVVCLNDQGGQVMSVTENVTGAIRTEEHGHQPIVMNPRPMSMVCAENIVPTLGADDYKEPQIVLDCKEQPETKGNNQESVYVIQGNAIDRAETAGCNGKGWSEDVCYTLNTIDRPAVFDSQVYHGCKEFEDGVSQTVNAQYGTGGNNMPLVVAIGNGQAQTTGEYDKCPTLRTMHDQQAIMDLRKSHEPLSGDDDSENIGSLCADDYKGINSQYVEAGKCQITNSMVRRLTPMECERLQGYPDGWTDIPGASDAKRYKALGNSICLPFWAWLADRFVETGNVKTVGSLFDGIAGFPLVFKRAGAETRWTSEIDPFPESVCKYHFGDEDTGEEGDLEKYLNRGQDKEC